MAAILILMGLHSSWLLGSDSPIKSDEVVEFFPSAAWRDDDAGGWRAAIHGWIYEPEEDDLTRLLLLAAIEAAVAEPITDDQQIVLRGRLQRFLVDNERGKRLHIALGEHKFELGESSVDGHFTGEVLIPDALIPGDADHLEFSAVVRSNDNRQFTGVVQLVPPTGVTIISDIDDTVKITEVRDRRALVRNTFLEPFSAAPGMAERYSGWVQDGARLHFVSNGPWQLYAPLREFLDAEGFPSAAFAMKRFRLKDGSLANLFANPLESKLQTIEPLLTRWPERRFILVGDTGESDPEAYGELARRHPGRVARTYLRNVTGETASAERFTAAFRDLPAAAWRLFDKADELPTSLADVLSEADDDAPPAR